MKEVARDWVAQGLKPQLIWDAHLQRFNLDEASMPALPTVQRFVYYHVTDRLGGSDFLSVLRSKIGDTAFTGQEEEASAFTFSWRTDGEVQPLVGNGSDANPFVLGISTKKLLRQAARDPAYFILHLDTTYKLTQAGYPVIVVVLSDRVKRLYPLAIFIAQQQRQPRYTEVLSLLRRTYTAVTGNPLRVQFVMGDDDVVQWNAV
ncbi:hypothetical protein BBJ28_00025234 [Nothophytophthora sp. Chile5]|nr:hypothetical protein BBJ28_00025234 [Nothophytophthora sp. Chile5]